MLTGCNCFQIWQRVLCVGMKGLVSAHFLCKLAYSIHSSSPGSPGLCHSAGEEFFSPGLAQHFMVGSVLCRASLSPLLEGICIPLCSRCPGQSLVCPAALVEFGGVTPTS